MELKQKLDTFSSFYVDSAVRQAGDRRRISGSVIFQRKKKMRRKRRMENRKISKGEAHQQIQYGEINKIKNLLLFLTSIEVHKIYLEFTQNLP